MSARWPWSELGLARKSDLRTIKKAYAQRLKEIDRNDPDAFGALHSAFTAAKARASAPKAAKPKMHEIASDSIPVQLPAPPGPPLKPSTATQPPPQSAPPKPASAITEGPAPNIATPKPPKMRPWGLGTAELDSIATEDPGAADEAFFLQLEAAMKTWPWNVQSLEKLMALDMAQDLTKRRSVERRLFNVLEERVTDPEHGYPSALARFIEEQFAWAEDGVGAARRQGQYRDKHLIMHAHAVSLPRPTPP